ncbi:MAG: zinc transporter ZupT [Anaerolineae bacterium]
MAQTHVLLAFGLTLLAGLSTGLGSLLALFAKRRDMRLLAATLGFSAGVMIYVSLVEILRKARESLVPAVGERSGNWATVVAFFAGILLVALIDKVVPSYENPHEAPAMPSAPVQSHGAPHLLRMGLLSALAIGIHNLPEGLATFTAALKDPALGISIAIAIALHNIPEGIAVAVPIFYATGSKRRAFFLSALSGLAEPIGAGVGYLLLRPFLNDAVFGFVFAAVAGIMVFVSLDQLLPTAERYGEHHIAVYGLFSGMAVMAASLLLFL